nr:hypothetical protein [Tanacetum cinerariifolium]
MQTVDEAFVMANYSQLDPLMQRRMKELRLQGIATRLNYSSEDVYEERQMEAPPEFQSQPPRDMEGQTMQGIPPLLASILRETERMRTVLPREAPIAHNPNQQLYQWGEMLIVSRMGRILRETIYSTRFEVSEFVLQQQALIEKVQIIVKSVAHPVGLAEY